MLKLFIMNGMDFEKIGKFIATLRKNKKLTQLQLAELTGASDKTISKWENGNSFPDLSYQSNLCKALEIELDELHAGQLNVARRKRRKRRKIINRFIVAYAAITIPLIIFLCLFFVNNYDSTQIYRIDTSDNDATEVIVRGTLIETNQTHMLYIGNINLWNYEVKDTDIISVDIYSDDKLIFHSNVLEDIIVKYDENTINKNNLSIKVNVMDKNNKEHSFETKIEVFNLEHVDELKSPKVSEHKLLSEDQIIKNLKEAGFKESDNNWMKTIKNKNRKETIIYVSNSQKIIYNSETDSIVQNSIFLISSNKIETQIYQTTEDENVLFEKYVYDYNNDKLECQVGVCSTLENVLKNIDPYIILLNGES